MRTIIFSQRPEEWDIYSSPTTIYHNTNIRQEAIGVLGEGTITELTWVADQEQLSPMQYLMRMAEQNKADYEYLGMMMGVL